MEAPYINAKAIILDDKEMYIGPGNFYENTNTDRTRELGIVINIPQQIEKEQFEKDWNKSETKP